MPFITPEELITTKKSNTITVVFGRFQPPTLGHKGLFDLAVQHGIQNESDVIIVPTSTCEKTLPTEIKKSPSLKISKDICSTIRYPLSYEQKKQMIQQLYPESIFPNHRFLDLINHKEYNQLITFLTFLNTVCGYKELYFIAGDERVDQFQSLIKKQNTTNYKFQIIHDVIDVAQGQSRLEINVYNQKVPMSGTLVRISALLGLKEAFYQSIQTYDGFTMEQSNHWMNELRRGMGLKIDVKEQDEEMIFLNLINYLGIRSGPETKKRRLGQSGGFYLGYLVQLFRQKLM